MCVHIYACCVRVRAGIAPKLFLVHLWCLLEYHTNFCHNPRSFGGEINVCTLLKVHARFNMLCVHASMCAQINIINWLRRPIRKYAESFVKIWLDLADILRNNVTDWPSNELTWSFMYIYRSSKMWFWPPKWRYKN